MPSIALPLSLRGQLINTAFSPSMIAANSTAFLWLDPSDLTTMFQDAAGTTPVTAPAQPVGLVLDKSQGLVLGPELVTNGDFSGGATGWTVSTPGTNTINISGGSVRFVTNGSADTATLSQPWSGSTAVGKYYRITFDVLPGSTGTLKVVTLGVNSTIGEQTFAATPGAKSFTLVSANSSIIGIARVVGQSADAYLDNISVRELPGFHATQSTAASRPTYGVVPSRGRVNLLTFTEQFDNAAWSKQQATVTANSSVSPDGTMTADTLLDTAVSNIHYMGQSISSLSPSGKTYTVSAYLKASTLGFATLGISDISSGSLYAVAVFNLSNGTLSTSGAAGTGYSVSSTSITAAGDGWYRCTVTAVAGTSVSFLNTVIGANKTGVITAAAGGFESYLGNGSGVLVWGAQIEQASTATPYQRVVSQFDVTDPVGFPSYPCHYLSFDGVDDFLVTPTIDPAANAVPGPELVTNGDFSNGATGWTLGTGWSVSGGQATFTATGANSALTTVATAAAVSGRTYEIRYTVVSNSLNGGAFRIGAFSGNSYFSTLLQLQTTPGTYVARLSSAPSGTGTVLDFWVTSAATSGSITIDNISVREVVADKVQVFAGVRKLSDAAVAMLLEHSTNVNTNSGVFWLAAPLSAATANYQFNSKGTVAAAANYTNAAVAAPISNVLTGLGDISGDLSTLRVNGTQAAQSTADQGTGNYLAYPLFIGRRGGTSLPFNGQLYGLIVRFSGTNLDASLISNTERWMGGKTGVTI